MMTEKRFVYGETDLFEWVEDNGEMISTKECVDKLNELYEENKKLKHINYQLEKELKSSYRNLALEMLK